MDHYGNGPSTGQIQSGARRVSTLFKPGDLQMTAGDRQVLRQLAQRVAMIADSPVMAERRQLRRRVNALEKTRPVILCEPENGWNEIITERQMQCQGRLARHWEMDLRKEIFWGEEMGDDKPVDPYFNVPCVLLPADWGVEIIEHKPDTPGGSLAWEAPIKDYEKDLERLKMPQIRIDRETSKGSLEIAGDTFGDILTVRQKNRWWSSLGITKDFIKLRGLMNLFTDFYDHPDGLKALLSFISKVNMAKLVSLKKTTC